MELSFSTTLRQSLKQDLRLSVAWGETSGDIPLFSLHRIKNRLKKVPIPEMNGQINDLLVKLLLRANHEYREETGNRWNCLTAHNLDSALEKLSEALADAANKIVARLDAPADSDLAAQVRAKLDEARQAEMTTIRRWFNRNFDFLRYDLAGKIPWTVIRKLQANLAIWAAGQSNPFSQGIEDMVLEVARNNDITTDDPGQAWIKMGGKILNKSRA
ncbi:hypothetical protein ACFL04_04315 [Patescibacteria group bacterium]